MNLISVRQTRHFPILQSHYANAHATDPDFRASCVVRNCKWSYKLIKFLCRHIRVHHPLFHVKHLRTRVDNLGSRSATDDKCMKVPEETNVGESDNLEELPAQPAVLENYGESTDHVDVNWNDYIAKILLYLREEKKLPSVAIKEFANRMQEVLALQHSEIMSKLQVRFDMTGIDPKAYGISDILNSPSAAEASCSYFSSVKTLDAYVRSNFKFVNPQEYRIDNNEYGKTSTCQYVPILETLKTLLSQEDVFQEVINGHVSNDGVLRDLCDGSIMKEHPLFTAQTKALQLVLYYDEFIVVNPIGSKVKKFKMGTFYMTLANIPPQYRSQLKSIYLVLLFKSHILKKCS